MNATGVFYREQGSGPSVICLHSNASTSGQWRALMEQLSPRFRVLAPDALGSGKSPPWPTEKEVFLHHEVDLLRPVFEAAGASFYLVGHSYGGAVALKAAVEHPEKVKALVLYEPTLFALVETAQTPPNDVDGIRNTVNAATACLKAGDAPGAARCFIDFWMGDGTWDSTPPRHREAIATVMANVAGWRRALFEEPAPIETFAGLHIPVLLMTGTESPRSSLSVATLLSVALPQVERRDFAGRGHMAPITHAKEINHAIASFLDRDVSDRASSSGGTSP